MRLFHSDGRVGESERRGNRGFICFRSTYVCSALTTGDQRLCPHTDGERYSLRADCDQSRGSGAGATSTDRKMYHIFRLCHQLPDWRQKLYHQDNHCDRTHTDSCGATSPGYPKQWPGNITSDILKDYTCVSSVLVYN